MPTLGYFASADHCLPGPQQEKLEPASKNRDTNGKPGLSQPEGIISVSFVQILSQEGNRPVIDNTDFNSSSCVGVSSSRSLRTVAENPLHSLI